MSNKLNREGVLSGLILVLLATAVRGQGTFVYDQQSSDESFVAGGVSILANPSQSFTPNLSSISFIRLYLGDADPGNGNGATVRVNLRSDSVSGTIIGQTDPVFMPDSFGGFTNFFFAASISLTPGSTYFFQPVIVSGDFWDTAAYNAYNYPGGMEFLGTTPFPNNDLWFREGVVPEPSSLALVLLGATAFALKHRSQCGRRSHEQQTEH